VSYNEKGEVDAVRYEAVNAILLNEFLKEHRKVEELEKARADEQSEIAELAARLKEQDSKIEKVSVQHELSKSAAQMVANDQ
jgi:hypothetical protein